MRMIPFRVLASMAALLGGLCCAHFTAAAEDLAGLGDCAPGTAADAAGIGARAAFEVGVCLAASGRADEAEAWFERHAATLSAPDWRAAVDNQLGQLRAAAGRSAEARTLFERARQARAPLVSAAATINLARLADDGHAIELLGEAFTALDAQEAGARAPLLLALGREAASRGAAGRPLARQAYQAARAAAEAGHRTRENAQALDGLAQLSEDAGDGARALALNSEAVLLAGQLGDDELLLPLAWRRGRLLRQAGELEGALAAFEQAADHLERIRQDIPVTYADGRSSFRVTFEPIYLGLADLLLRLAPQQAARTELDQARRAVERVKQSELEDYLGDRCLIGAAADADASPRLAGDVAVLYPIMLEDRLELLIERQDALDRVTVAVPRRQLERVARSYAAALRRGGLALEQAGQLHRWLLAPVEHLFGERLDTLVVVPDAGLRLFPFASLYDGERYAIEKYAVATAPGLDLTQANRAQDRAGYKGLLAGLAEPGEVVDKLPAQLVGALGEGVVPDDTRSLRGRLRGGLPAAGGSDAERRAARSSRLQQALALPSVRDEIRALERLGAGKVLLDGDFTVAALERELGSGRFRLLHIASHGVFGSSAETTFLMAHDDIITIDRLQQLLRPDERKAPIELLTLSACDTAEGDDRAPLGLAGAALRARASAALGSLWPVADEATKELMEHFYRALLGGASKVEALRSAQRELLRQPRYAAPFYWAPFILVGDWN